MIPLRDEIPTRRVPVVNYALIAVNILIFVWMALSSDEASVTRFALIPSNFTQGVTLGDVLSIFTSMFMHAGLAHIGGNMLYLWIFGDNVEDRLGHFGYLAFYLFGGLVASLTHLFTNFDSPVPTVGASGAIAAVLGAYLVLYPQSRIVTFIPIGMFMRLTLVPAAVVLGLWFVIQFFNGMIALGGADVGGVAVWAHIGGFIAGVVVAKLLPPEYRSSNLMSW
jgi:membrane associated rhomboid family serine protease